MCIFFVTLIDLPRQAFEKLISMPAYGGKYYSLTPDHPNKISDETYVELVKEHIMFKDMSADSYLVDAGIANVRNYARTPVIE
eukprot:m.561430 g.561430  ORF g.561430 m.561430 type:complete len:83 (-) comp22217_c0_seq2:2359-2607(-)